MHLQDVKRLPHKPQRADTSLPSERASPGAERLEVSCAAESVPLGLGRHLPRTDRYGDSILRRRHRTVVMG
jgi:hypothetical protein